MTDAEFLESNFRRSMGRWKCRDCDRVIPSGVVVLAIPEKSGCWCLPCAKKAGPKGRRSLKVKRRRAA